MKKKIRDTICSQMERINWNSKKTPWPLKNYILTQVTKSSGLVWNNFIHNMPAELYTAKALNSVSTGWSGTFLECFLYRDFISFSSLIFKLPIAYSVTSLGALCPSSNPLKGWLGFGLGFFWPIVSQTNLWLNNGSLGFLGLSCRLKQK